MPSRTAQKRNRTSSVHEAADPVARAMRSTGPRCQCEHSDGRCRRTATYRVSVLCAEEGCRNAVHVYLRCTLCKGVWFDHVGRCRRCPELRASPL